ncbi:hypothetical protein DFQ01_102400 [Paenibacillus cellulosilyticus]|uniref:Uncharacterized protein n=1 Tax=Paenibacillus cellulosilyticus TaxID=375489 RepID=A0A2V2YZ14_9BACL|nr:DUF5325 family protein [Paenibacillus cellulosilyticus]PWW07503.1 hypothetical protein DFQ01_102400 [Paenibacillus cellulosilyticus]QKS44343.1 DUF5325 family protein [Paenibacillus cellulosilyticus]
MSKMLSLWFALSSTILMGATAVMISHNGWIAVLLALVTVCNVGFGFVVKARARRRSEGQA